MRRLKRAFWFAVALVFLFEAWIWDLLQPIMARLVAALPLEALRRAAARIIDRLPPYATLAVFAIPAIAIFPFKLAGLWLFATGHPVLGAVVFVAAKSVGFGVTLFLFELCRPKLMQMAWFAKVHDWFVAARAWAHAQTEPARAMIRRWRTELLGPRGRMARRFAFLRRRVGR